MTAPELFHWNPSRRVSRFLPERVVRPLNNFGDLLGPWVVRRILDEHGIDPGPTSSGTRRLLSIGSVLHLAQNHDVVWGSGLNGKAMYLEDGVRDIDVRAVRGPHTAAFLRTAGLTVPDVFGDPGILVSQFWKPRRTRRRRLTVIPNLNDFARATKTRHTVDPRTPLQRIVDIIAASDFVTGSSLHAVVVAESFGVPARLLESVHEPSFKFLDYYAGTGRPGYAAAHSPEEAVDMGGEPSAVVDPSLLKAFPFDLWSRSSTNLGARYDVG